MSSLSPGDNLAAIVLCAGKGTRMKSEKAKLLHPLLGHPLCWYPIRRALELGVSRIVAVLGHQATEVRAALEQSFPGQPIRFALQTEQKGSADAARSAQSQLSDHSGPIVILNGDLPLIRVASLQALVDAYRKSKAVLAIATAIFPDPTGYGRVVRSGQRVLRVVEEKDSTPKQKKIRECNAGIYVAQSAFLWDALEKIRSDNAQQELYLTDLVELAARKKKVGSDSIAAEDAAGVNDRAELAACAKVLQRRINCGWMKAGVTVLDPDTAYIAEGIEIGSDSEIGPSVSIIGQSRIGRSVSLGQGTVVVNSEIGDRTEIRPYSVIEGSKIGRECIVGPFSRMRPGSQLEPQVHLGNFVETKKAHLGKGSKANHLSYLGDAEIGSGVNIGAGTITCNYDGTHKYQTVIGDGVFVGSDTQFIAPVRVGDGAYIAAGTTVTEDVPPLSLTLSRTPQVNKEGWVAKKKAR
jgi:bifunctional UDP-N-acetylglucosamine pyrophosphorylase / glucosamine-1-phosphate N-acetyltransferase